MLSLKRLDNQYMKKNAEKGPHMVVEFTDQGEISFDIPLDGIKRGNGWFVVPISAYKVSMHYNKHILCVYFYIYIFSSNRA